MLSILPLKLSAVREMLALIAVDNEAGGCWLWVLCQATHGTLCQSHQHMQEPQLRALVCDSRFT